MSMTRERTDLDKKPTWFIFMFANFLIVLGTAITWILFAKQDSVNSIYLPTLICNLLALALCVVFLYFEMKDIAPKIMHFQRKWLWIYVASGIVFILAIIFNASFFFGYLRNLQPPVSLEINECWPLILFFTLTAVLTLISIGLQRYARFKIDLDIYRRKRGKAIPEDKPKKDSKASSGLIDQM